MSPPVLNVYPERVNQTIEKQDNVILVGRQTRKSSSGKLFVIDQYTGQLVSFQSSKKDEIASDSNGKEDPNNLIPARQKRSRSVAFNVRKEKAESHLGRQSIVTDNDGLTPAKKSIKERSQSVSKKNTTLLTEMEMSATKRGPGRPRSVVNQRWRSSTVRYPPTPSSEVKRERGRPQSVVKDNFRSQTVRRSPTISPAFKRVCRSPSAVPSTKKRMMTASPSPTPPFISFRASSPDDIHIIEDSSTDSPTVFGYSPPNNYNRKSGYSSTTQFRENVSFKMDSDLLGRYYPKTPVMPCFINGKIAINYEDFDFSAVIVGIKTLYCYDEKYDDHLGLLKFADREITENLCYRNTEEFYEHELIPAIQNWKRYCHNPDEFYDPNSGKYELFVEDGRIIETPLDAKPEIFPHQIFNRQKSKILEENLRKTEKQIKDEDERLAAEAETLRRAQEAAQVAANLQQQQQHVENFYNNLLVQQAQQAQQVYHAQQVHQAQLAQQAQQAQQAQAAPIFNQFLHPMFCPGVQHAVFEQFAPQPNVPNPLLGDLNLDDLFNNLRSFNGI